MLILWPSVDGLATPLCQQCEQRSMTTRQVRRKRRLVARQTRACSSSAMRAFASCSFAAYSSTLMPLSTCCAFALRRCRICCASCARLMSATTCTLSPICAPHAAARHQGCWLLSSALCCCACGARARQPPRQTADMCTQTVSIAVDTNRTTGSKHLANRNEGCAPAGGRSAQRARARTCRPRRGGSRSRPPSSAP
jgi:hypothetical protein